MTSNQFRTEIEHGEDLFLKGEANEAITIFDAILQKDPDNIAALNDKGVALNHQQRYEEAVGVFLKVVAEDSTNSNAVFNLISNYFVLGKWNEGEDIFSQYGQCLPESDVDMIKNDLQKRRSGQRDGLNDENINVLKLTARLNGKAIDFRLCLDLTQFSQQIMSHDFNNNQFYEAETSQFIGGILEQGDCFVDIGSHIGYFSLLAASLVGKYGKVLAFEPDQTNYNHLIENLALNKFENVTAYNVAMGSEVKKTEFFVNLDNDGGHALWDVGLHPFNVKSQAQKTTREIQLMTLDRIIQTQGLKNVKVIKIDTEGSECNILRGALNTMLDHNVPFIICEVNHFGLIQMGTNESELRSYMEGIGYDTYAYENRETKIEKLPSDHQFDPRRVSNVLFSKDAYIEQYNLAASSWD